MEGNRKSNREIKLNLGCGNDIKGGYINLDIDPKIRGAVCWDVSDLSIYADGSVGEVLAFDIIEHFSHRYVDSILSEWCRVLSPGGKLYIRTPDIDVIFDKYFQEAINGKIKWKRLSNIIHGGQDNPNNYHFTTFSFEWLHETLELSGMTDIIKIQTECQNMLVEATKK